MANETISTLPPGVPPFNGGTLVELSVPTGGVPAYASVSGRKVDILKPTQIGFTVNATLTEIESGAVTHNFGAVGTVLAQLPAAVAPLDFEFVVTTANNFGPVAAGSDTIVSPNFSGTSLTASTIGSTVKLRCIIDGQWLVVYATGSWS